MKKNQSLNYPKSQVIEALKQDYFQMTAQIQNYGILFSNAISGVTLCRYVRIFQYLDEIFSASENAATGQQKKFYKPIRFT